MPQKERPADDRPRRPAEPHGLEERLEDRDEALTEDELEESTAGRRTASVSEPAEEESTTFEREDKYPRIGGVTPLPNEPPFYTTP